MIGKYISELLYKFDSVTLPGFGTFLKESSENMVHPVDTIFSPPATKLKFDATQQHNDGVLANYMAEKENISFLDALEKIRLFIQELNAKLDSEKTFLIPELGTFLKENDQLIYSAKQDICLDSSLFGLVEIHAKPIVRPKKKFHAPESKNLQQPKIKKKKRIILVISFSLTVLAFLCLAVVFLFKPFKILTAGSEHHSNLSGNCIPEKQKAFDILSKNLYRFSYSSDTTKTVKTEKKIIEEIIEDTDNIPLQEGNYAIVAGSFRIQENANNFVIKLKAQGYSPVSFDAANGLHVVCYGAYPDLITAKQKLEDIKTSENPEAWIIKH